MTHSHERSPISVPVRHQVGWLLRSHRMLSPDRSACTTAAVARACPGGVDPSTVSRWETGRLAVPHRVVRTYEQLYGLRPHSLVAVLDNAARYRSGTHPGPPALTRRTGPDRARRRLGGLLDRVSDGGAVRGADWDELTGCLSLLAEVDLRDAAGSRVSRGLVSELLIADGLRWFQRYEALARLMVHPAGQRAAIDACVQGGRDRGGQMFTELICALECSAHPDANTAVVDQLEHPTNRFALTGALMACARKIRLRHFTAAERHRIDAVLDDLRTADGTLATLAAEAASGPVRTVPDDSSLTLVRRVVDTARRSSAGSESFVDEVFPRLVHELLYADSSGDRLCAGGLLGASPYRAAVAAALCGQLQTPRLVVDRPDQAERLLVALRPLGGVAERRFVQRLAVDPAVPARVARAAAYSAGHLGPRGGHRFWERALAGPVGRPEVFEGLVYGAGTDQAWSALAALRHRSDVPEQLRSAARWWLGLPRSVVEGATL